MAISANALVAAPNWLRADPAYAVPALSGGNWDPAFPLSNILDPLLVNVARSVDLSLDATRFWTDLGTLREIGAVVIPFLGWVDEDGNAVKVGRDTLYRIRIFDEASESSELLYDSDWQDLFPVVYPEGSLPAEAIEFTDGKLSEEDAALFPMPAIAVLEDPVIGRFVLIELDDALNDTGAAKLEVPGLFITPGRQNEFDMVIGPGPSLTVEDPSVIEVSMGGAEFPELLPVRRIVTFLFKAMSETEAMVNVFDLQVRLGTTGQVFFAWDPTELVHRHRRSWVGRLRKLNPVELAAFGVWSAGFEISESIA